MKSYGSELTILASSHPLLVVAVVVIGSVGVDRKLLLYDTILFI